MKVTRKSLLALIIGAVASFSLAIGGLTYAPAKTATAFDGPGFVLISGWDEFKLTYKSAGGIIGSINNANSTGVIFNYDTSLPNSTEDVVIDGDVGVHSLNVEDVTDATLMRVSFSHSETNSTNLAKIVFEGEYNYEFTNCTFDDVIVEFNGANSVSFSNCNFNANKLRGQSFINLNDCKNVEILACTFIDATPAETFDATGITVGGEEDTAVSTFKVEGNVITSLKGFINLNSNDFSSATYSVAGNQVNVQSNNNPEYFIEILTPTLPSTYLTEEYYLEEGGAQNILGSDTLVFSPNMAVAHTASEIPQFFFNLQDAIDYNGTEDIYLAKDIVLSEMIVVPQSKNKTIVLSGHHVTVAESTGNSIYAFDNYGTLKLCDPTGNGGSITARGIYNHGNLTVEDISIYACDTNGGAGINNRGNLTVNDARITTNVGLATGIWNQAVGEYVPDNVTITDTIIECLSNVNTFAVRHDIGNLVINGSENYITGTHGGLAVLGGTVTINAGSICRTGITGQSGHALYAVGGSVTVYDGYFRANDYSSSCVYVSGATVKIYNAIFTGGTLGDLYVNEGAVEVGEMMVNIIDVNAQALLGNKFYADINDALEDVQDGQTVKLLKNLTVNSGENALNVTRAGTYTIDLNNKTITANVTESVIKVIPLTYSNITIENGTINAGANTKNALLVSVSTNTVNANSLTLTGKNASGFVVEVKDYAKLNLSDSKIVSNGAMGGVLATESTVVQIRSCEIEQKNSTLDTSACLSAQYNGTIDSFNNTYLSDKVGAYVAGTGGTINLNIDEINAVDAIKVVNDGTTIAKSKATVSGNTFNGLISASGTNAEIIIYNGTFNVKPDDAYIAEGLATYEDTTNNVYLIATYEEVFNMTVREPAIADWTAYADAYATRTGYSARAISHMGYVKISTENNMRLANDKAQLDACIQEGKASLDEILLESEELAKRQTAKDEITAYALEKDFDLARLTGQNTSWLDMAVTEKEIDNAKTAVLAEIDEIIHNDELDAKYGFLFKVALFCGGAIIISGVLTTLARKGKKQN